MTRLDAIATEGDDRGMSIAAEIQNANLRRARHAIANIRHSASPAGTPTRAEVADALDAIIILIAPFSQRPENLDAEALLATRRDALPATAVNELAAAAAEWSEAE